MSGAAELHKAMKTAWTDAGLDAEFRNRWALADRSSFLAYNDGEAAPGTPFPYVVYDAPTGEVVDRMSGDGDRRKYLTQDFPWTFRVFAGASGGVSAKAIAVALAEKIIETFGGHPSPTVEPVELDIGPYGHLQTQYQSDYGAKVGDDEYVWTIEYVIKVDMPVSV